MQSGKHWLNQKRFTVYPRLAVATQSFIASIWFLLVKQKVDLKGQPLGNDFIAYWSASYLALAGRAADAYNTPLLTKAENIAVPASHLTFFWLYPPTFYMVVLPLAAMPYLLSCFVFMFATLACYVFVFRRVIKGKAAMWCLAGFPGLCLNLFDGQNAFLTGALAGAGLICMESRPILAGVFMGLLVIKPHLLLLFPVALVAIRAWRTLFSAAVTAIAFIGLSAAVLGMATWKAFFANVVVVRAYLEQGLLPWQKMPTVFAFLRILHAPVAAAYVVQGIGAAAAVSAVWYVWRRSRDWQLRSAALMTATFLVTPYVMDYDMAWLAFPIAWLALIGLRDGWLPGEREVLVACWILPLFVAPLAAGYFVQVGPFPIAAMLWLTVRRARAAQQSPVVGEVRSTEFEEGRVASGGVSP